MASEADNREILPDPLADKQETSKDGAGNEDPDDTASTVSKRVRILRNRKKSGKNRLTRARKQLCDLLAVRVDVGMATKTDIRRAVNKVKGEHEIIEKIIHNLKEIIALGEDGDENIDVDTSIESLDTEIDEITVQVDQAIKAADDQLKQRLAMGEAESITPSIRSNDDDQSSIISISSTLAARRRIEAEEAKQRLIDLEKEQQQEEQELQNRVAALQLTKRRTEEARQIAALNQARAKAAEEDEATTFFNADPIGNEQQIKGNQDNSFQQAIDRLIHHPSEVDRAQQRIVPVRLKGVELPMFSGENKADYAPWKAAFMSVVDEAVISTKEKMLRLQNNLKGKALKMVKDLGYTVNAYERAKEKLEKKYGGERRLQITHLTTLRGWPKLRQQNLEDMEEFLALLDRVLVSLQDSGPGGEMKGQNLNLTAKEKLSEKDIQAYKYWLFERNQDDTFEALVNWLEMRVQIMDETKEERRDDRIDDRRRNRGYSATNKRHPRGCIVKTCKEDHPPWVCKNLQRIVCS